MGLKVIRKKRYRWKSNIEEYTAAILNRELRRIRANGSTINELKGKGEKLI